MSERQNAPAPRNACVLIFAVGRIAELALRASVREPGFAGAIPSDRAKGHLFRILGVGFGIAVIVGGTISSGSLRTPGEIVAHLGSYGWIIVVWLLGGVTVSVPELGNDAFLRGRLVRLFPPSLRRLRGVSSGVQ